MKKLLIVDDEVGFLEMVRSRMETSGFEVVVAQDGQTALEMAQSAKPDLIVLDIMLPKVDGYKVCGLLKSDTRYMHIPIILFSVKAHEKDEILAGEVHADAYITKLTGTKMLLSEIRKLLGVSDR